MCFIIIAETECHQNVIRDEGCSVGNELESRPGIRDSQSCMIYCRASHVGTKEIFYRNATGECLCYSECSNTTKLHQNGIVHILLRCPSGKYYLVIPMHMLSSTLNKKCVASIAETGCVQRMFHNEDCSRAKGHLDHWYSIFSRQACISKCSTKYRNHYTTLGVIYGRGIYGRQCVCYQTCLIPVVANRIHHVALTCHRGECDRMWYKYCNDYWFLSFCSVLCVLLHSENLTYSILAFLPRLGIYRTRVYSPFVRDCCPAATLACNSK